MHARRSHAKGIFQIHTVLAGRPGQVRRDLQIDSAAVTLWNIILNQKFRRQIFMESDKQ